MQAFLDIESPPFGYKHEQQRFTERFTGGHAHRLPYIKCTHCRPRCQLRTTCNLETAVRPRLLFVSRVVNVSLRSSEVVFCPKIDLKIGINCRRNSSTERTQCFCFLNKPFLDSSRFFIKGAVPGNCAQ